MIREWFADKEGSDILKMFEQSENIFPAYRRRAVKFYENFFT
jgi:hypothetical protein